MAKEGDSDGSGSEEYEWADLPRTFPLTTSTSQTKPDQSRLSRLLSTIALISNLCPKTMKHPKSARVGFQCLKHQIKY